MEKLVRDKIRLRPDQRPRIADRSEMPRLLARKLVEEAEELLQVEMFHETVLPDKRPRRTQELVDIAEVCAAIHEFHDIDDNLFEREVEFKARLRGSFLEGHVG